MNKLATGLMQTGAALCAATVTGVLWGTGALLPLLPWGAGLALLGFVLSLATASGNKQMP
ncbi:MAG: hypothetical protein LBE30_05695 [Comamonas sp.]|jgi:VIT1/CCC1 family predicted Fe2+/Mn2+ transporter|nr:hypothetical protein [Comamonas sp.]